MSDEVLTEQVELQPGAEIENPSEQMQKEAEVGGECTEEAHEEATEEATEEAVQESEEAQAEQACENPETDYIPSAQEITELRSEVIRLREQLEERSRAYERMSRECAEFSELFPGREINSLPPEVWEEVRRGVPLAAAYACAEVRRERRERLAAQVNDRNSHSTPGPLESRGAPNYYSPSEVRGMSASEVRENYNKIIDSMKLWS